MLASCAAVKRPSVFVTFLSDGGITERVSAVTGFFPELQSQEPITSLGKKKEDRNILPYMTGGKFIATTCSRGLLGYLQIAGI